MSSKESMAYGMKSENESKANPGSDLITCHMPSALRPGPQSFLLLFLLRIY